LRFYRLLEPIRLFLILPHLLLVTGCSDSNTFIPAKPPAVCQNYADYLHLVGLVDTPGNARGVALAGSYACLADGGDGPPSSVR
jgi:hypothetical protein